MKMKYKCVGNVNKITGTESKYLTVGKVYDFEIVDSEFDFFGEAKTDCGNDMLENFTEQYHGQWEKVE